MKSGRPAPRTIAPLAIFAATLMFATIPAFGSAPTVLHTFRGGTDGIAPYGRVTSDAAGNLYGTTILGGTSGAGTVFELAKPGAPVAWSETVLYTFTGGNDGAQPYGGVIFDAAGNLYGTTYRGGTSNAGTVYQLAPPMMQGGAWTETVLYSFANGTDGFGPQGDLTFDQAGNIYGTTDNGGSPGNGIVFQLSPPPTQGGAWTETILHTFVASEGTSPRAAVIFDKKGALYGTLANDGQFGAGAVFRLEPPATKGGTWTQKTLYMFGGGFDGLGPLCTLSLFHGNLYGTTVVGGVSNSGTVFQLTPPASHHGLWSKTTLYTFHGGKADGHFPWAGLTMDKNGVLYGTTQSGGLPFLGGTVFQLKQAAGKWTESVIFSFKPYLDQDSTAGLLLGKDGALYGATIGRRGNAGMVFRLRP